MHLTKSKEPFQVPFFYGWIIVAIAGLGVFFSGPGQTYSISIFIDSYLESFGWSSTLISSIYSSATLLAGLLLFIVGRLVDRFGQRKMMISIAFLLGIGAFWNSFVVNPIMLFFGFFVMRLFGQGSMTLLPNTLVPQWFIKKRGRALSFMAIGGFLSSASFPPINAWLINTWSWQIAWRVWGFFLILFFVPIAYFLIRNKPEDVGLLPDGIEGNGMQNQTKKQVIEDLEVSWTLKEAMKTRQFWLILVAVAIPSMVNTGMTFHLPSILRDSGLEQARTTSAYILSLMAIIGFGSSFIAGFAVERIKVHKVLAFMFIGELTVLFLLQNSASIVIAILFGMVWGFFGGIERIALNIVWPNYFGREHLGSIKGVAMTSTVIGSAFGPLPFGMAYDIFGGYREILFFMMLFPVFGIVAALASSAPKKKES